MDTASELTHVYRWRKWLPERHGEPCRLIATGRKNSVLIEFADGLQVITSRYAIRRRQPSGEPRLI